MVRQQRSRETLIKAARMYYLEDRSQKEVAEILGTTPSNVSRMLTTARQMGIVRIRVEEVSTRDQALERQMKDRFGLTDARILSLGSEDPEALECVGRLAADWLTAELKPGQRVGLSWGTALQAMISAIDVDRHIDAEVVQLVGGLTGSASSVTGEELVRELAGRLGCGHHYLHAPAVFASTATRLAVAEEPAVQAALERARRADIAVVGIGAFGQGSSAVILDSMDLNGAELAELDAASPVGDICGHFYDIEGRECQGALHDRVLAIELSELVRIPLVAGVAAGAAKARGLLGALSGGLLDVVICDQVLAERTLLLAGPQGGPVAEEGR